MRSGGQANSSQTPCPIRRLLEPSRPGTTGFDLVVPKRKPLTFMFLGHQDPCLLVSFLLRGVLMTPDCESHHVGNNVGTHKHRPAKGPAFNYQDAEGRLQVRPLWQVLGVGRENPCF